MTNALLKSAIRTQFLFTPKSRAIAQAGTLLRKYMLLAERLSAAEGRRQVEVPPMPGVDEEMRRWSFFMILEHNTIVNRGISATVQQLVNDEPLHGAATINPKTDVDPRATADEAQVRRFRDSVAEHLAMVKVLGRLRGTRTAPHVIFGDFDAHKWNCMFAFHLGLHYRQAAHVVRRINSG